MDHEKDTITGAVVSTFTADRLSKLGTEAGEAAEHAVVEGLETAAETGIPPV